MKELHIYLKLFLIYLLKFFALFKPMFMLLIYAFYTLGNIWNGLPGKSVRFIGNYMCF